MADYDNRLRFTLFRNKRKEKDTHADFNGTFTDQNGNEYYMDAWSKTPNGGGEKFLSGVMKPKAAKAADRAPPQQRAKLDDEIPF